jgi:hypothetical protein
MTSINALDLIRSFLQVRPIFFTREEFKAAANAITQTGYTPEHRSNTEELLGVRAEGWQMGDSGRPPNHPPRLQPADQS